MRLTGARIAGSIPLLLEDVMLQMDAGLAIIHGVLIALMLLTSAGRIILTKAGIILVDG